VQGVLRTAGGPDTEGTSAVGTGFEDGPAQP
jgi:hypothetical protein